MIRPVTVEMVKKLHRRLLAQSGGRSGLRDEHALEAAVAQPHMTFDGKDLYPTLVEKATALVYALVRNHPFLDGNKRVGHAAMEVFLLLNGYEIIADVDEQETLFLSLAAGNIEREHLADWVKAHVADYPKRR